MYKSTNNDMGTVSYCFRTWQNVFLSFFADFEIPYLQKDKITRIEIWVMHEIGGPKV